LINAKNSPGLAALSLCSINLCLIVIYLRPSAYLPESPSSTPLLSNQVAADNGINSAAQNPVPDRTAVIACLLVYFANVSIFSLFETITTPFLSDQLGWSVSNVALYFIGCSALMLMLFLFAVPKVQQIFGIRPTLAIGLSAAAMVSPLYQHPSILFPVHSLG
jgi:Na+/melibiose symporter-like transporter